ncbi:MAG: NYN domain-containing protein [Eubacteriales bacterium]|nr:NYN domain-containing protein [Eubacteriales bacterium]
MIRTAILVDGGFYRKRAAYLWGKRTPEERAKELAAYCVAHIKDTYELKDERYLYRVFYYDCPPLETTVYHPFLKKNIYFEKNETFSWTNDFYAELKERRKFALRLGTLSDERAGYTLNQEKLKKLCAGAIKLEDLSEHDFNINFEQKGVDMRIGLDIASLSYKKQVEQIILISGDSDFVPAAKLARREGIDFILDPMWAKIKDDLFEHIDGLKSQWGEKKKNIR